MGTIGNIFTSGRNLDVFNPCILLSSKFAIVGRKHLQSVSIKEKTCAISITNCDVLAIRRPVKCSRVVG